jgi:hypothetical protein
MTSAGERRERERGREREGERDREIKKWEAFCTGVQAVQRAAERDGRVARTVNAHTLALLKWHSLARLGIGKAEARRPGFDEVEISSCREQERQKQTIE